MVRTTDSQGEYARGGEAPGDTPGGNNARGKRAIEITLWTLGLIVLLSAATFIHFHVSPEPVELDVTRLLQGPHPIPCVYNMRTRSPLDGFVDFMNTMDDPFQSIAFPIFWMLGFLVFRHVRQAFALGFSVLGSSMVWVAFETLVARPRMTPALGVCVHRKIAAFSFPSGHVVHDSVFYGFLLYLSFTRPVRQWRYRWVLIPFQALAILYIIGIGYSRLEAGEHMLFDVLGGYLTGLLWLFLCIFVYQRVSDWLARRRQQKLALQQTS